MPKSDVQKYQWKVEMGVAMETQDGDESTSGWLGLEDFLNESNEEGFEVFQVMPESEGLFTVVLRRPR